MNAPENIQDWLQDEFAKPGWHSSTVAQELSEETLAMIASQYPNYTKQIKIGILFSLLYMRKAELSMMRPSAIKIIHDACADADDWVRILGFILQDIPHDHHLTLDLEAWSDQVQPLLTHLDQLVKGQGFGFHTLETMLLMPDAQPLCPFANASYRANQPTLTHHFNLSHHPDDLISDTRRQQRFAALIRDEQLQDDVISPTQPAGVGIATAGALRPGAAHPMMRPSSVPAMRPPPPGMRPPAAGAGANLFIRPISRRPSDGPPRSNFLRRAGPPQFQRPAMPRPIQRQESAGATPRGLVKHSRVQMLDFTDATELQKKDEKTKDELAQKEKQEKEDKKMQVMEERRLASERKQMEKERKKEEREAEREAKRRKSSATAASPTAEVMVSPLASPTGDVPESSLSVFSIHPPPHDATEPGQQ
ncbi:hypothetical protein DM01DRAFT_1332581 [Hesseltinella vesiculosa]|uniref:NELF-A N-terminal domain-containing protein n=1 Tax=Hesseltinella vesiculosa TaxID=101127 RepID=A0A1X2GSK2_9FUNG|nr:hypothetical protein DM01DRAFT_1332581 [Hesseltinella vesiculosa]